MWKDESPGDVQTYVKGPLPVGLAIKVYCEPILVLLILTEQLEMPVITTLAVVVSAQPPPAVSLTIKVTV